MKIPPFWAKETYEATDKHGQKCQFVASGWSFNSINEARKDALDRAKRIFDMITTGKRPGEYDYLDRPIKEEILKVIGESDSPIAIITRNRYGAKVLNCASALFVDVDFPRPRGRGFFDAIALMFSAKKREARQQEVIEEQHRKIEGWADRNPERSFRLYRTKEGFRLLFTDRLYDPTSDETTAILNELESDPLYIKLTQKQECFRARLTSKPWRCGCERPPFTYPWEDQQDEAHFREWENEYNKLDAGYKICDLVNTYGNPAGIDAIMTVTSIHDQECRVDSKAQLA